MGGGCLVEVSADIHGLWNANVIPAKAGIATDPVHTSLMGGWAYIMTNKPGGVLYIGVTADLVARVAQHREGKGSAFCRRYGLNRLVYAEPYPDIESAIRREKAMKAWKRSWKIELIEQSNRGWDDLYGQL